MFELNPEGMQILRTQFAISSWGGTRYQPFAFTEQGMAMLAIKLNCPKAIEINISIVLAFIALRQYALGYAELNQKLENFMLETNMQFNEIFQALTELARVKESEKVKNHIGYLKG